jgi:hypothetical protein
VELHAPAQSGRSAFCKTTRSVLRECRQSQRSLSELEHSIIEMMSPQLTRKFADIINNYNFTVRELKLRFWNEEEQNSLCLAMFRSVLTAWVYQYDDHFLNWPFTQNLVVENLDSVPGLRRLCLWYESSSFLG